MAQLRKNVLTIAGFDPTGGAGIIADIKTLEAHKVYGLSIASAMTYQTDVEFKKVEWIELPKLKEQITSLASRFKIEYVKIGLIESLEVLHELILFLKASVTNVKIVWDPILKASAGFQFHSQMHVDLVEKICTQLFFITPNKPEAEKLYIHHNANTNCKHLSTYCNVYLKGGHNAEKKGVDVIYLTNGKTFNLNPKLKTVFDKHGSGCVLSSALIALTAKGFPVHKACLKAKQYTERVLASNPSLLGYHKI